MRYTDFPMEMSIKHHATFINMITATKDDWIREVLKREMDNRGIPIEAKKIGNNYYAYKSTTMRDTHVNVQPSLCS